MEKFKVSFYRKGKRVIAVDENGVVGIAKCHPTDEFDFMTGAALAYERLVEARAIRYNDRVSVKFTGRVISRNRNGSYCILTNDNHLYTMPNKYVRKERG